MKWLKKLLGMETATPTTAPADAGAKAFDSMAKTLTAPAEVVITPSSPAPEPVAEKAPEPVAVVEAPKEEKPKAPRKPRAKKEPAKKEAWPFPGDVPAEGKTKPAARKVKAK